MPTILQLSCPDRVGLLARISGFVAQHGGNLVEVHQFTDAAAGWFFARMAIDTATLRLALPDLRAAFTPLAAELAADWTLRDSARERCASCCSSQSSAIASRTCSGAGAPANSTSTSRSSSRITPTSATWSSARVSSSSTCPSRRRRKAAAFAKIAERLRGSARRSLVLARYMQIVPPELCAEFRGQDDQHPPLVPPVLRRRESLPARLRARREAHRRDLPLRHRRARCRADHRPGSHPRGALPHARRSGPARARLRAARPRAQRPLAPRRPRAHPRRKTVVFRD